MVTGSSLERVCVAGVTGPAVWGAGETGGKGMGCSVALSGGTMAPSGGADSAADWEGAGSFVLRGTLPQAEKAETQRVKIRKRARKEALCFMEMSRIVEAAQG